jgi:hypothetical protein
MIADVPANFHASAFASGLGADSPLSEICTGLTGAGELSEADANSRRASTESFPSAAITG